MGKWVNVVICEWIQDFRCFNPQDSSEYGVTYPSKRSWVTLHRHESMESIIDTCGHEAFHMAVRDKVVGEDLDESDNMDVEEEHEAMKRVFWIENGWLNIDDKEPINISD